MNVPSAHAQTNPNTHITKTPPTQTIIKTMEMLPKDDVKITLAYLDYDKQC